MMLDPLYEECLEERIRSYRDRMEREYVTVSDAAEFLGVSRSSMMQFINEGRVLADGDGPFRVATASLARFKQDREATLRAMIQDLADVGLDEVDAATYQVALREEKKQ